MMLYTISALSVAAFGLCVAGKLIPPVTTCKRNSIDYSTCLTRAAQESWPRFVEGLPEFEFPRLDPLFIEYIKGVFDRSEIHGKLIASNLTADALSKLRFTKIKIHFLDDTFGLEATYRLPGSFVEGDADVEGTVGGFRIRAKGHFNITVEDVSGTWDLKGHVVNDTAIIESFFNAPQLEKFKLNFIDFDGNQELYDIFVGFVNEYWPAIYRGILPTLYKTWEPRLVDISNLFFSKVSFSELFPEN